MIAGGVCSLAAHAYLPTNISRAAKTAIAPGVGRTDPWAATADLLFKVAARDDGIPDAGLPRSVAQDGEGFVWIATDAGLARWDGTGFKTYSTDPSLGAGALPEPMVNLVFTDAVGRLWLGMSAEGLLRYDPATDGFHRPPGRTALDHAHVQSIDDDGAGGLWVGSDIGLVHLRGGDHVVDRARSGAASGLPAGNVQAVRRDRAGVLWVASGTRLFRRNKDAAQFEPVALTAPDMASDLDGVITALHDDDRGGMWVATSKSGFYVVDRTRAVHHLPIEVGGKIPTLSTIIEAGGGKLWAASRAGIWIIDPAVRRVRRIAHDPLLSSSLPEDGLNALARDRAGLIWAVGDASIAYVDPAPRRVLGIVGALRSAPTQSPDAAWSVGAAPDGSIWYGSSDMPAARLIPGKDGARAHIERLPGARRDVRAFAFPPMGGTAFAASGDGLFAVSMTGQTARRLSAKSFHRLLLDGTTLYAGGNGVAVLDVRRPGAPVPARWSASLTDPRVRSMAFTTDRSLWVGTASGLNRIDAATGAVTRIRPQPGTAIGLKANYVSTLLGDRQGRLWAGTVGGGITIFARRAGFQQGGGHWRAVRHIGRAEGLPHDTVDKLLLGSDGAIWVSTDGGIARIDPVHLTVTALRASDGVAFIANWTGAGDILPDGRLLFAGFGGLTLIDPRAPVRNPGSAALRFTAVTSGGKPFVPSSSADLLTIPADQRNLTAEFARLDFAGSRDQAYAYRLFPLESEWTRVDAAHRIARYTNLPPGRSTLVVRALASTAGPGLRAVGAPLSLELDVERRWYETTLFRATAILGTVLAIVLLYHLRTRTTRRRQKILERLVRDRTAELLVSQSELEKLAYSDTLTGLGNRRLYGEVLARHLHDARQRPFALLLIDLDRFKHVNDDLGHDVGDALLVEVADRLTALIRERDSIFRLGGDEFAIVLTGIACEQSIGDVCRRIYTSFTRPVAIHEHKLQVALSIGVVIGRDEMQSTEEIYKLADVALYDAKRAGRGTWRMSPVHPRASAG
ncbi:diguanylate cyclase domain-containing protein [Sphingomonas sp. M1A8_2b]